MKPIWEKLQQCWSLLLKLLNLPPAFIVTSVLLIFGILGLASPSIFKEQSSCVLSDVGVINTSVFTCSQTVYSTAGNGGNGGDVQGIFVYGNFTYADNGSISMKAGDGGGAGVSAIDITACDLNGTEINASIISQIDYNPECDSPEPWALPSLIVSISMLIVQIYSVWSSTAGKA